MDARTISLCVGAFALAFSGFLYGTKFIKKGNYLIGVEWYILAISSTNAFFFFITLNPSLYAISHYFDAFSRAFGLPILAVAGLMALTHDYKPSVKQDVIWFAVAGALTFVLIFTPALAGVLPYFYVVMWTPAALYLAYFAGKLWQYGEKGQALGIVAVIVTESIIAGIYDFYKIPGEETNVILNFFTIALFVWAFLAMQIYYGYCALERAMERSRGDLRASVQTRIA